MRSSTAHILPVSDASKRFRVSEILAQFSNASNSIKYIDLTVTERKKMYIQRYKKIGSRDKLVMSILVCSCPACSWRRVSTIMRKLWTHNKLVDRLRLKAAIYRILIESHARWVEWWWLITDAQLADDCGKLFQIRWIMRIRRWCPYK
jgi:hypothetical protein